MSLASFVLSGATNALAVPALGGVAVAALESVNEFVDWLARLPMARWVAIGRTVTADRDALEARATSSAILDAVIAERGFEIAAWYVRDAVQTAAFWATNGAPRLRSADRRAFEAARAAADAAAMSLLARDYLADNDFAVLSAPLTSEVSR